MGLTQIEYVNEWNNDIIHGKGILSGFLLIISTYINERTNNNNKIMLFWLGKILGVRTVERRAQSIN